MQVFSHKQYHRPYLWISAPSSAIGCCIALQNKSSSNNQRFLIPHFWSRQWNLQIMSISPMTSWKLFHAHLLINQSHNRKNPGTLFVKNTLSESKRTNWSFPPVAILHLYTEAIKTSHSRFTGRCKDLSSARNCIMVPNLRDKLLQIY